MEDGFGKRAIVVAGMHRSGTSATAGVLGLLGCDLPRSLMNSASDNERGFWESVVVQVLNDEILESLGCVWSDWKPIGPDWHLSPAATEFRARAHDAIGTEYGDSNLFVLKDPRICRLFPLWLDAIRAHGAEPVVLSPIRNPISVAKSLNTRDGIDLLFGYLSWTRHVLEAEAASRGLTRAFFRYEDLVSTPQVVVERLSKNLGLHCPTGPGEGLGKIPDFISSDLHHHRIDDTELVSNESVEPWARSSFEIFDRWSQGRMLTDDIDTLNRIRSEFDEAMPAFERTLEAGTHTTLMVRSLRQDVRARDSLLAERDAMLARRDAMITERDAMVTERDAIVMERDAMITERDAMLAERDATIEELITSNSWKLTAPIRGCKRILVSGVDGLNALLGRQDNITGDLQTQDHVHWSIDAITVQDHICCGHGWMFHESEEISEVRLEYRQADGSTGLFWIGERYARPDVASGYPDFQNAMLSGFTFFCSSIEGNGISHMTLVGMLPDGMELEVPVSRNGMGLRTKTATSNIRLAYAFALLKRAVPLVLGLQFGALISKSTRYLSRLRVRHDFLSPVADLDVYRRQAASFVIDHDMGGGANNFREELVAELLGSGKTVVILKNNLPLLVNILELRTNGNSTQFRVSDYSHLEEILESFDVTEVIYNNAVSFIDTDVLVSFVSTWTRRRAIPVRLMVHDFYMVCPSFNLLDVRGRYCGVPDHDTCRACLPRNSFPIALPDQLRNPERWRMLWSSLVSVAEEIRFFSNDSLEIFLRAYPSIELEKVSVQPHSMSYFEARQIRLDRVDRPRIGIVGNIMYSKGAKIVRSLAREIRRTQAEVDIVVVGSISEHCDRKVVRCTGLYERRELADLVEKNGISMVLVPSIWPETFSYVCHEVMALGLPLACFDIGAQAEVVAKYEKGRILKSMEASEVLRELSEFHKEIYGGRSCSGS